jgi:DNA polymerase III subunit delta'
MHTLGQQRAIGTLLRLIAGGRVPHALLLLGKTGWGTLSLALDLVQRLQCERSGPADPNQISLFGEAPEPASVSATTTVRPDCDCAACTKNMKSVHPDVHFSYPTVGTNAVSTDFLPQWRAAIAENPYMDANTWLQRLGADNKQGNINTAECNAILKKLSLKAFEGRYKILLLWLPEYLGKEGNRLLKMIEEPPENTQFILVAENADAILPTVLSRCQLVKTDALTDHDIADGLKTYRQLEETRALSLAFLTDGDFGKALQMADTPQNDDAALFLDWLRKCWRGNGPELLQWTDGFAKLGRENQKQFLYYGLHFLRELLQFVAVGQTRLRLAPEELVTAQNMGKVLNFEKINQISGMLNDNIYYLERNANPKILFLNTAIKMNSILKT